MGNTYQVRVLTHDARMEGQAIQASGIVYADSELEARVLGAELLGVARDRVSVEEVPT